MFLSDNVGADHWQDYKRLSQTYPGMCFPGFVKFIDYIFKYISSWNVYDTGVDLTHGQGRSGDKLLPTLGESKGNSPGFFRPRNHLAWPEIPPGTKK